MKIILVLSVLECIALSTIEARDARDHQYPGGVITGIAPDTHDVQNPPAAIVRLLDKLPIKHKEEYPVAASDSSDHSYIKKDTSTAEPMSTNGTSTDEPVTPEEPYTEWWEILLIVIGFMAGIALIGLIIMIAITNMKK